MVAGLSFCAAYLDDVVIFSETWKEHLTHLEQVFVGLEKAGLTVKASKCQILGCENVCILVMWLGMGQKPEAVNLFPVPRTKKQLRSFLGLSSYYRQFIHRIMLHLYQI